MAVTFYPNYIHNVGFIATAEPTIVGQGFASSGGETTGAAYDLVDSSRDNLITIDTNGEATDFTIDFDLTSNIGDVDFCIIDKANLPSAFAAYGISHGGVALTPVAWAGVLGEELNSINITSDRADADAYIAGDDVLLLLVSSTTDNNWEIDVIDFEASNFTADVTIGEISIGKKFASSYAAKAGIIKSSDWGTNILKSKGGQKYGFRSYGEARRWQLSWEFISAAERTNFETVWQITEGKRFPFYIDLGENSDPTLYFVRFAMTELRFVELTTDVYSVNIIIEEEI